MKVLVSVFLHAALNYSDPRDQTLEFEWHEIDDPGVNVGQT
jgi:hypothetical protein